MIDLAARVHYKLHFDIVRENEKIILFDEVIFALSDWIEYKYKKATRYWNWSQFRKYGDFSTDDYSIHAKTTSFINDTAAFYWACKIDEFENPNDTLDEEQMTVIGKAPRIWTTEVGFEQISPERAIISYIVYYADKAGFIGIIDEVPKPNTPRFVKTLLNNIGKFSCEIGNDKMLPYPILLKVGNGNEFAGKILDTQRKAPILLVMPRIVQQENIPETISVKELAKKLAKNVMGNALVYEAENATFAEEMTYFLDRQYWCYPGQIKLYWPITNNLNKRNRYLLATQIEAMGEDSIVAIFRRVFSQDVRYYESKEMFRLNDCDDLYRKSRFNDLRARYSAITESEALAQMTNAEIQEQLELSSNLLKLSEEENIELSHRIESLDSDLSEVKQECRRIKNRNDCLAVYQEKALSKEEALTNIRRIAALPQTNYDVAMYFRQVFCDKIDFTEKGMRTLTNCITKPEILWSCFFAIATTLTDLYISNIPDIENAFKTKCGWDMARGEGSQTHSNAKLMALRKDWYQDREILIEPHVRRGNRDNSSDFVRVYFCFDHTTSKIIIGHVGGHLDNHTTLSM